MQIASYPDTDILSRDAAQYIVRLAAESIVMHGSFTIALSGGTTPKKTLCVAGQRTIPQPDRLDTGRDFLVGRTLCATR